MQGSLEKQKIKASAFPAPGSSDAKAAFKHALEIQRKENIWPARAKRKRIWIAEDYYNKTKLLSGMQHG
jgi:hypothetical protein